MKICIKIDAVLLHCVYFNNIYNQHWNWYLFCLFSLVPLLKQQFNELISGKYQTNEH